MSFHRLALSMIHLFFHDIILPMPEQPDEEEHEEPEKQGQTLGCIFALLAVGLIVLLLFFFLRACA